MTDDDARGRHAAVTTSDDPTLQEIQHLGGQLIDALAALKPRNYGLAAHAEDLVEEAIMLAVQAAAAEPA